MEKVKTDNGNPQARPVARGATATSSTAFPPADPLAASEIKERQERIDSFRLILQPAMATRAEEFSMTVGKRVYSGKGATRGEERRVNNRNPFMARRT